MNLLGNNLYRSLWVFKDIFTINNVRILEGIFNHTGFFNRDSFYQFLIKKLIQKYFFCMLCELCTNKHLTVSPIIISFSVYLSFSLFHSISLLSLSLIPNFIFYPFIIFLFLSLSFHLYLYISLFHSLSLSFTYSIYLSLKK